MSDQGQEQGEALMKAFIYENYGGPESSSDGGGRQTGADPSTKSW